MNKLHAFIVGTFVPVVVLPLALSAAIFMGKGDLARLFTFHFLAVAWGGWNVFHVIMRREYPVWCGATCMGLFLGIVVSIYALFVLHLPARLGFTEMSEHANYIFFIGIPLVYALLWRYVVRTLNRAFGVYGGRF